MLSLTLLIVLMCFVLFSSMITLGKRLSRALANVTFFFLFFFFFYLLFFFFSSSFQGWLRLVTETPLDFSFKKLISSSSELLSNNSLFGGQL